MNVGDVVKHRSEDGYGTVVDTDGLRYHHCPVVLVMWTDLRGTKYEPVNELKVISASR